MKVFLRVKRRLKNLVCRNCRAELSEILSLIRGMALRRNATRLEESLKSTGTTRKVGVRFINFCCGHMFSWCIQHFTLRVEFNHRWSIWRGHHCESNFKGILVEGDRRVLHPTQLCNVVIVNMFMLRYFEKILRY